MAAAHRSMERKNSLSSPIRERKQKKKAVILERIAEELEPGRRYTEKEINELLKAIHSDYVFLRRYLIEFGFMDRERNCSFYWKKG